MLDHRVVDERQHQQTSDFANQRERRGDRQEASFLGRERGYLRVRAKDVLGDRGRPSGAVDGELGEIANR
jgi:hypothetical protein